MKIQTLGWLIGAVALASAGSFIACSQAPVVCAVGHAGAGVNLSNGLSNGYATKYFTQGAAAPACAKKGDIVGFETYHTPISDTDKQPDFSKPTIVALQSAALDDLVKQKADRAGLDDKTAFDADGTHKEFSIGPFATNEPDASAICAVPTVTPAQQQIPSIDAHSGMGGDDPSLPAEPATSIKYEWSNMKLYMTATAPGTQFTADLHYTEDTCTVDYKVIGSWPAVPCGGDADCCPAADPNGGRPTGSGINPDFPMKCELDLKLCVLDVADASKLPVLKVGWADTAPQCALTPSGGTSASTGQ